MPPSSDIRLIEGQCLAEMDKLSAQGARFDLIFADPPYFLSNGGITCQNGKMVKVDKGAWDRSEGADVNHQFNLEWMRRCRDLLGPNGTLMVSGTFHVIYSVGFAMQQLEMKILNNITWEKPNPPPNLACRTLTHSTETIIWAARDDKAKYGFNYAEMKQENGDKQMKDVWRFTAPRADEKTYGKHPTQKPIALMERLIRLASDSGDQVLDPFMGSGTTGLACQRLGRHFTGIEMNRDYITLAQKRLGIEV